MVKFVGGMTTMGGTERVGEDDGSVGEVGLLMPTLAACPGFRPAVSRDFVRRGVNPWPLPHYFDSHPEEKGTSC